MPAISEILDDINDDAMRGGIFLPYIQRDFVWSKEKIYLLLDSLMRQYPVGTIMTWETGQIAAYRKFEQNYKSGSEIKFIPNNDNLLRRYVIDGQQRLQSLYIAARGSYNGETLFFNLFKDPDKISDIENIAYEFKFMSGNTRKLQAKYWLNVPEFLSSGLKTRPEILAEFKKSGIIPDGLNLETKKIILKNAVQLYRVFNSYTNLIHMQFLNSNIDINGIAEIFVRLNSAGVQFDKMDLLMTFMQIDWASSGENIHNLRDTISSMGYKNPATLMVRMCLAMLAGVPGGLKNDLQIFSGKEFQDIFKRNFKQIQEAISDVLIFADNILNTAKIKLPYISPLLVLARYRYIHGRRKWNNRAKNFTAFLFAAFLSRVLSRPAQALMKALLKYAKENDKFLLSDIEKVCGDNHQSIKVDAAEILKTVKIKDNLAPLVMHIVYYGKDDYAPAEMVQKDHIFPVAELRNFKYENGRHPYTEDDYDDIANCAMLNKTQNNQKTDKLPEDYFDELKAAGVLDKFLELHEIPKPEPKGFDIWSLNQFKAFVVARRDRLFNVISQNLRSLGILQV